MNRIWTSIAHSPCSLQSGFVPMCCWTDWLLGRHATCQATAFQFGCPQFRVCNCLRDSCAKEMIAEVTRSRCKPLLVHQPLNLNNSPLRPSSEQASSMSCISFSRVCVRRYVGSNAPLKQKMPVSESLKEV